MTRRHHTILVPMDFSAGATLALERTLRLPLARHAKIVLLHVLDTPARGDVETWASERLAQTVAALEPRSGLEITHEIAEGKPFEKIITRARTLGSDLIVMGRHGRRVIRDLFIGSTASRTLRYGDVPVLVVNSEAKRPYKHPLVATDLDDASPRVFELALSVLDPDVEGIDVVHAYRIPFEGTHFMPRTERLEHELEAWARERLDKLLQAVGTDRARWRPILRCGDARSIILSELIARGADLVVLGTHGRSGLAHALIGSVAEYIVSAAPCDVLITRPARFTFSPP